MLRLARPKSLAKLKEAKAEALSLHRGGNRRPESPALEGEIRKSGSEGGMPRKLGILTPIRAVPRM